MCAVAAASKQMAKLPASAAADAACSSSATPPCSLKSQPHSLTRAAPVAAPAAQRQHQWHQLQQSATQLTVEILKARFCKPHMNCRKAPPLAHSDLRLPANV